MKATEGDATRLGVESFLRKEVGTVHLQLDAPRLNAPCANPQTPAGNPLILDDGTHVLIRPIVPADSAALQRFHSRLTAWSIYLRFFQYVPVLSPDRADYFTQLDGVDRYASVALDPLHPAEIIAVARYDRDLGTAQAEFAILVEDRWQGHGLGLALTRHVIAVARAAGIRQFYAYVLPENARMLNLFRDLPLRQHRALAGGIQRVDIDLCNEAGAPA